jgi:hypothetical protein
MKASILDERNENGSRCYLCKIGLEEYISSLSETYRDYPIQRQIVRNVYLDELINTVFAKKHIPPIVLVAEKAAYKRKGQDLEIDKYKILDGLQRTHRLKIIYDTVHYFIDLPDGEKSKLPEMSSFTISRTYARHLREFDSSSDIFSRVVGFAKSNGIPALLSTFKDNIQWFEVWVGLTLEQEVYKMLVLNAGHKPVSIRHQLELLFLNVLPTFEEIKNNKFRVIREREQSATSYSKKRGKGEFHFAHLIAALLSYEEGQPITTNTGLIQSLQNPPSEGDKHSEVLQLAFLQSFVSFLLKLDDLLEQQHGAQGTQWLGREVVMVGLMGAIGSIETEGKKGTFNTFLKIIADHPHILNLEKFEEERNNLELSKVNIGNVNKDAVYQAIKHLITSPIPHTINWKKYFLG